MDTSKKGAKAPKATPETPATVVPISFGEKASSQAADCPPCSDGSAKVAGSGSCECPTPAPVASPATDPVSVAKDIPEPAEPAVVASTTPVPTKRKPRRRRRRVAPQNNGLSTPMMIGGGLLLAYLLTKKG